VDWVRDGSALLLRRLDQLGRQATAGPSLLPGWSRAHVLTHLARNADALVNLTVWARTGVEHPMYPDAASRTADIERGAQRLSDEVLTDVLEADSRLLTALATMPAHAWHASVRSAMGRCISAAEIPWMRTRELWVHLIDLDMGDDFDILPDDLVDALLVDASAAVGTKSDCPAIVLRPIDRINTAYRLGPKDVPPAAVNDITATAAALCAWLLGRPTPAARAVAANTDARLPPWL